MKIIKLSLPANAAHAEKQSPASSCVWGDCHFFINKPVDYCDAWVVCDNLPLPEESTICPGNGAVLITGEPRAIWHYNKKFIKQFSTIITSQREIKGPGVIYSLQGHGWHVGLNHANSEDFGSDKSYDELIRLRNIPKTKLLSIVASNKQSTVGHRQRYRFALKLKEALGDRADLFGRGINDFNDKWDVLAPYKYSVAIENCATDDYISEKLFDCFLTHTFPFYYGAPNVSNYYSPDSYSLIDINNFSESVSKIKKIINDPSHYQEHLVGVIESKLKYLNHYNIFPLIVDLIKNFPDNKPMEKITLKNAKDGFSWSNRFRIIGDKFKLLFEKL